MAEVVCPYCSGKAVLTSSAEVYGGRDYGPIYLCRPCHAYVGCHKGTNRPLGRLADAELRDWKKRAHAAFDPLWKQGYMERRGAYAWLGGALEKKKEDCHIGMFDVDTCKKAVEVCQERLAYLQRKRHG